MIFQKSVSNRARYDHFVGSLDEFFNQWQLVRNFRAAHNRHKRPFGIFESLFDRRNFFFEQKPSHTRKFFGDFRGRSVRSMNHAKSVLNKQIRAGNLKKRLSKFGGISLFVFRKAQIFEHFNLIIVIGLFHRNRISSSRKNRRRMKIHREI